MECASPRPPFARDEGLRAARAGKSEGGKLTGHHTYLQESNEKAAALPWRHLAQIGGAGPVLSTHAQTLEQTPHHQKGRCRDADRRICRRHRDQKRTETHKGDGHRKRYPPPPSVGV